MTNDEGNPKPECGKGLGGAVAGFVIRISSFVIRICDSWFMGSPLSLLRMHRDHEPLAAWSPGFSRSERFVPPEGGTPNQRRFMESLQGFIPVHRDHERPLSRPPATLSPASGGGEGAVHGEAEPCAGYGQHCFASESNPPSNITHIFSPARLFGEVSVNAVV